MHKGLSSLSLLIMLFVCLSVKAANLQSTVDRNKISIDETLTLTIKYTGKDAGGNPDFSQLRAHFDILSQTQSNQFRSYNGVVEAFTLWNLTLSPGKTGKLFIPSLSYAGQFSEAIEIDVVPASTAPQAKIKDIFLETVVNKTRVFVQEQIIVTYRLYYAVNIDSLDAPPLELDNVIVERLEDARYRRTIANRSYNIAEFSYALFPQTSDNITIPQMRWTARFRKGQTTSGMLRFGGKYETKRLRTKASNIEVKPKPESYPDGAPWLPADALSLRESWSKDPNSFTLGEPITRTLTLSAKGLMSSQLPEVLNNMPSGSLKVYADQPKKTDNKLASGYTSERIESAAIVIEHGAKHTISGAKIPWWNVTTDTLEYAELAPRHIVLANLPTTTPTKIAGNNTPKARESTPDAQSESDSSTTENGSRLWQVTTLFFVFVSTAFSFLWWHSRRNPSEQKRAGERQKRTANKPKESYQQLAQACQSGDVTQVRTTLLAWGKSLWPDESSLSLQQLAEKIGDATINQHIQRLDACMYGVEKSQAFEGEPLLRAIDAWQENKKQRSDEKVDLAPLYPVS